MINQQAQERRVITLYGECSWNESSFELMVDPLDKGFVMMNVYMGVLAVHVTVHSVSYSHIVIPEPQPDKILRFYATVVYSHPDSGVSAFQVLQDANLLDPKLSSNALMIGVRLR